MHDDAEIPSFKPVGPAEMVYDSIRLAKDSVAVLCDETLDFERLSYETRGLAPRRIRLRLYVHGLLEDVRAKKNALDALRKAGWLIRGGTEPVGHDACVLVDEDTALLHRRIGTTGGSSRRVSEHSEVQALASHFAQLWSGSKEVLYDDFVTAGHPDLTAKLRATDRRWDQVIAGLTERPNELYELDPQRFEAVVAELLRRQGLSNIVITSQTHDGGRDLLVSTDTPLGQHLYLVECKRYRADRPVEVGLVRSLYGVVEAERATAALLVTTSYFTKSAIAFRERVPHRLALADYEHLVGWLSRLRTSTR